MVSIQAIRADEGMWLYTAPPRAQMEKQYGFSVTEVWLDHVMKSSVRFNSGGSGAFVSADGLVITNHHVGYDALQKMSTAEKNYVRDGFMAKDIEAEVKCADMELNVLQSIEDVTGRVNAALPAGKGAAEAAAARKKIISEIESESREKTGLRSNVIVLYQGGAYHLYRMKRYTDVRLVFAPEEQAALFGGDPDNFEFPRYDLDICFFRVYENGHPVRLEHFLKWSMEGPHEGEMVIVSGHPGSTSRLLTLAELEYLRDKQLPFQLEVLKRREVLLTAWSARSEENARRAKDALLTAQNARKVRDGQLAALQNPAFIQQKAAAEMEFRRLLATRADGAEALAALDRVAQAQAAIREVAPRMRLLESGAGFESDSFTIARQLLRAGDERSKPNGERLREYTDARRESLEQQLFSDKPIYPDFEVVKLGDALTLLTEQLGYDDVLVQTVLAGQTPRVRAANLIRDTRVREVAFRKELHAGGAAAVAAAHDPMIEVARAIDEASRVARRVTEVQTETKRQAYAVIGATRFALQGTASYPDATFTLRLSYGAVRGYEVGGAMVPPMTTLGELYARSQAQHDREPFDLPPRWAARESAVDRHVPLNFVSTCDIIGGNSGSPTVNRAGEFVGIVFDNNEPALAGDFGYDADRGRAISVHSAGILEVLRHIYGADALIGELTHGAR